MRPPSGVGRGAGGGWEWRAGGVGAGAGPGGCGEGCEEGAGRVSGGGRGLQDTLCKKYLKL